MRLSYFNGDNIVDLSLYGLAVFYLFWSQGCKEDPEVHFYTLLVLIDHPFGSVFESSYWFIPHNVLLA